MYFDVMFLERQNFSDGFCFFEGKTFSVERHSSMISTGASYQGGPRFKSQQGRKLLILNKKDYLQLRD